jgi:hypothetical protein
LGASSQAAKARGQKPTANGQGPRTNDRHPMPHQPQTRRMKTYTGGQGYVYQYYFVGKRAALANEPLAPATEYIFDVSSDRKLTFAVSVFLPEEALRRWGATHGRGLIEAEQYGAVKMKLFQAFDEIEDLMQIGRRLVVDENSLEQLLRSLGID